jgi:hypothetical protein
MLPTILGSPEEQVLRHAWTREQLSRGVLVCRGKYPPFPSCSTVTVRLVIQTVTLERRHLGAELGNELWCLFMCWNWVGRMLFETDRCLGGVLSKPGWSLGPLNPPYSYTLVRRTSTQIIFQLNPHLFSLQIRLVKWLLFSYDTFIHAFCPDAPIIQTAP